MPHFRSLWNSSSAQSTASSSRVLGQNLNQKNNLTSTAAAPRAHGFRDQRHTPASSHVIQPQPSSSTSHQQQGSQSEPIQHIHLRVPNDQNNSWLRVAWTGLAAHLGTDELQNTLVSYFQNTGVRQDKVRPYIEDICDFSRKIEVAMKSDSVTGKRKLIETIPQKTLDSIGTITRAIFKAHAQLNTDAKAQQLFQTVNAQVTNPNIQGTSDSIMALIQLVAAKSNHQNASSILPSLPIIPDETHESTALSDARNGYVSSRHSGKTFLIYQSNHGQFNISVPFKHTDTSPSDNQPIHQSWVSSDLGASNRATSVEPESIQHTVFGSEPPSDSRNGFKLSNKSQLLLLEGNDFIEKAFQPRAFVVGIDPNTQKEIFEPENNNTKGKKKDNNFLSGHNSRPKLFTMITYQGEILNALTLNKIKLFETASAADTSAIDKEDDLFIRMQNCFHSTNSTLKNLNKASFENNKTFSDLHGRFIAYEIPISQSQIRDLFDDIESKHKYKVIFEDKKLHALRHFNSNDIPDVLDLLQPKSVKKTYPKTNHEMQYSAFTTMDYKEDKPLKFLPTPESIYREIFTASERVFKHQSRFFPALPKIDPDTKTYRMLEFFHKYHQSIGNDELGLDEISDIERTLRDEPEFWSDFINAIERYLEANREDINKVRDLAAELQSFGPDKPLLEDDVNRLHEKYGDTVYLNEIRPTANSNIIQIHKDTIRADLQKFDYPSLIAKEVRDSFIELKKTAKVTTERNDTTLTYSFAQLNDKISNTYNDLNKLCFDHFETSDRTKFLHLDQSFNILRKHNLVHNRSIQNFENLYGAEVTQSYKQILVSKVASIAFMRTKLRQTIIESRSELISDHNQINATSKTGEKVKKELKEQNKAQKSLFSHRKQAESIEEASISTPNQEKLERMTDYFPQDVFQERDVATYKLMQYYTQDSINPLEFDLPKEEYPQLHWAFKQLKAAVEAGNSPKTIKDKNCVVPLVFESLEDTNKKLDTFEDMWNIYSDNLLNAILHKADTLSSDRNQKLAMDYITAYLPKLSTPLQIPLAYRPDNFRNLGYRQMLNKTIVEHQQSLDLEPLAARDAFNAKVFNVALSKSERTKMKPIPLLDPDSLETFEQQLTPVKPSKNFLGRRSIAPQSGPKIENNQFAILPATRNTTQIPWSQFLSQKGAAQLFRQNHTQKSDPRNSRHEFLENKSFNDPNYFATFFTHYSAPEINQ